MEDEAMKKTTQITDAERVLIRALASASGARSSAREGTDEEFDPARQAQYALQSEHLYQGLASQSLMEALLEAGAEFTTDVLALPKTEEDRCLLDSILMHEEEGLTPETVEGAVRALRSIHLRRRLVDVRTALQRPELSLKEKEALLQERDRLARALIEPEKMESVPHEDICSGLLYVNEWAVRFFERCLQAPEGVDAREYIKRRGISEDAISRCRVGYAPNSKTTLCDLLCGSFSGELLRESSLLCWSESGSLFSRFRNRLMFPIVDEIDRVVAFSGLTLSTDLKAQPEYLEFSETALYSPSQPPFSFRNIAMRALQLEFGQPKPDRASYQRTIYELSSERPMRELAKQIRQADRYAAGDVYF